MKVLILSCNTGEGHNSAAKAVKEKFESYGISCNFEDSLAFVSKGVSEFISGWHVRIYRYAPGLFRVGYRFSEKHSKILKEDSISFRIFARGSGKLYDYCMENEIDVIICTHVFSSMVVTDMLKKYDYKARTYFIATDYTCAPGVNGIYSDGYFIPHDSLKDDFVSGGIKEKLIASGIPIRQMFSVHTDKESAKKKAGLEKDDVHLLIMCGSMGCGPIKKLAAILAQKLDEKKKITVVCGTNKKLFKKLDKKYKSNHNVRIRGYVTDMSLLMDSADLCITKPGGISVTEAAAKRLPMIFVDAVAGCEKYNMKFFVERGGAVTASDVNGLASECVRLLNDRNALREMSASFDSDYYHNASQKIYDHILNDAEVSDENGENF